MSHKGQDLKSGFIKKIIEEARSKLGAKTAKAVEPFLESYYRFVPVQDLIEQTPAQFFSAAFAHWKFGSYRKPGVSKVRVYNPTLEEHGWECGNTIIELITDDMRFLLESVIAGLNRWKLPVHLTIHPVIAPKRDQDGAWVGMFPEESPSGGAIRESYIHCQITEQSDADLDAIQEGIEKVLADVRVVVQDWRPIRERMAEAICGLDPPPADISPEEAAEVRSFLSWIHEANFTFLGYREYLFGYTGQELFVSLSLDSGLGILRDAGMTVFEELGSQGSTPPEIQAFAGCKDFLMVNKSNRLSPIRRAAYMDALAVKLMNKAGEAAGVGVFIGLFTASAYNQSAMNIPLLRMKVRQTILQAGLRPGGHDGKALINVLENFPRDELFQVPVEHLLRTGQGIMHLQERQRVALFVRLDDFERFVSCLVYIPRDRHCTKLRRRIQQILETAFEGKTQVYYTQLADSPSARLHILIKTTPGKIPNYDASAIEAQLVEAARDWTDVLQEALIANLGEEQGLYLTHRYCHALCSAYKERFDADVAIKDIGKVEKALKTGRLVVNLYRPIEAEENQIRLKIYKPSAPIPLSSVLPVLEHMGLRVMDEFPFRVTPGDDLLVMIHDFGLETQDGVAIDLGVVRANFQEAFSRIWSGEEESDSFNALALRAGLGWRQISMIRAYAKFLRQTGIAFSESYMSQTLFANPSLARRLVELFMARLFPEGKGQKEAARILDEISKGLNQVASADEDRIIRRFVNLVECTLRTNYFQKADKGTFKPYLSFKLDSQRLDGLPLPRPMVEIFVYSPRVEGVHLRFGKVARGGLRWSDRPEDFRTEILGLAKAQVVKNTAIVPMGSKGGFSVKRPPMDGGREALAAEGVACYKIFIRGLLDLTDNLVGDTIVPPSDLRRLDGDDPYLVVAADKGTATFSDIANEVSADYGFWLGDAFASGGRYGYDHKGMGITAKGAWESVKRHFRELGVDIQSQDFTVIGIGDMGGDVFGNGMLLSKHICLAAAFNHLHIFVDPDPDPLVSFKERQRLFEQVKGWDSYRRNLISDGGGVFSRSSKYIEITPEMKRRFGLKRARMTPTEFIRSLLKAKSDLFWFGGIGAYVKASAESHADTGDRANDALRINAGELGCKVVGEGANLGMTQPARIEFALAGGRLNADFIDNAGGVNCSDHEVNVKILIDAAVTDGDVTPKQRNNLLAKMTSEVADLVLRNSYVQSQAITIIEAQGLGALNSQIRLMRFLEKLGRLNRAVEFLPDDETLAERAAARQALTRPEIAVIMSYAKIWLYDELLASPLPDDKQLEKYLTGYFPTPIRKKFKRKIKRHRLKRDIIATIVTNNLTNRVGGTFVSRLMERTGMTPGDIARAYIITTEAFHVQELWLAIEALDNKVPAVMQTRMLLEINSMIERVTLWFLRHGRRPLDIGEHMALFEKGVQALTALSGVQTLPAHYQGEVEDRARPYIEAGAPKELALVIAGLVNMASACDIVCLAASRDLAVPDTARLYFAIGTRFRLGRLRASAERLPANSHWQKLAITALIEEIYAHQCALTGQVLDCSDNVTVPDKAIKAWTEVNHAAIERTETLLSELWGTDLNDYAQIAVACRQLRALAEAPPSAHIIKK